MKIVDDASKWYLKGLNNVVAVHNSSITHVYKQKNSLCEEDHGTVDIAYANLIGCILKM